ncbi:MAG TPA: glycosyltransferase family 4 protein [Vicinamibacteria bacterium]|nr:glycosyltransferase family 4 protein [Vicinamibacteria bacterium]
MPLSKALQALSVKRATIGVDPLNDPIRAIRDSRSSCAASGFRKDRYNSSGFPMRILTIAPQPFFQPRGTPFSELYRARALTELGHEVDMVTYPIGEDVTMPGLRILRTPRVPGIRRVRIGPSLAKIPLDALVFTSSLKRLLTNRYDLLDCHEEAGLMGVVLGRLFSVPVLYDMHSSLPEQLSNFQYSRSRLLRALFDWAERVTVKGSDAVIVVCPYLKDVVSGIERDKPCFLIENSPLAESGEEIAGDEALRIRRELGLEETFVIHYSGTFESYQGLPLLYEAFRMVAETLPSARLLMVGGTSLQVDEAKREVARYGLGERVVFTGQRPPSEMPRFLAISDVLVSPRSSGTNTPLKIYSYLRAGKPIVATRLLTHTQALDDECAALAEPTPEAFAEALLALARDPKRRLQLGMGARRLSEERYSYARYMERTREVLDFVSKRLASPGRAREAAIDR